MGGVNRNGSQGAAGSRDGGPAGAPKEPEKKIDWKNPDRIYSYTDAEGRELFQVVRYHFVSGPGKTFRQRMRDPGNPKANREGWVHSVPEEIRARTIYRLPKVLEAIRKGEPVYVVEGEKDVETLERMGKTATCNAGGAGKWRDEYSWHLAGADVIILPDNDPRNDQGGYPGQDHALDVAYKTYKIAKRVRIVNLKEACPELKEKGDITDLVEAMGETAGMDALARQIAATKDFTPDMVPFWLTPALQTERLYATVAGYGVENGCIVQRTGDSTKPLCDFTVLPRKEIIRDDGVNRERLFQLDGWSQNGERLERVTVSGAALDSLSFVTDQWGFQAAIMPGSTVKPKIAWCIKKVGQRISRTVVEYSHTGWRTIGGKCCYLCNGGAIGAEGITVSLGNGLETYRLDGGGSAAFLAMDKKEAARKSLQILEVARRGLGIALLGTVFLAPLREWMDRKDIAPAFSLFLHGQTQTRKSTITALAMAHFGNFHAKNAPANFKSTGNQILKKAFFVKDMPFWVDDFHPTDSPQEKRVMNATAQALARAFGDGAARGRLNADGTLQASMPPRSIAIITGEDLPAVGASGLARFFIVEVDKGDVPVTEELTALQRDAQAGWLQKSMRGYIEWIAKQADKLPDALYDKFIKYREMTRKTGVGEQERSPEAIAWLLCGYEQMLLYFVSVGALEMSEAGKLFAEAGRVLAENSRKQSRDMEDEKPSRIFTNIIGELIATGRVYIEDLVIQEPNGKKQAYPMDNMIGWRDNENYYLLPDMAYKEVSRVCREEGHEFPVSLRGLYKHLIADGVVAGVRNGESAAKPKYIKGKTCRVLTVPVGIINGDGKDGNVERVEQGNFLRVDKVELPEEFK